MQNATEITDQCKGYGNAETMLLLVRRRVSEDVGEKVDGRDASSTPDAQSQRILATKMLRMPQYLSTTPSSPYTITESLTHKDYFDTKKCFVLNIN